MGNLYETFENFDEFKAAYPDKATEALNNFEEGDWQEESLYYYADVESFAKYEVCEGWYSETNLDRDWGGAPNLLEFIDYKSLGEDLVWSWDDISNFQFEDGSIVTITPL